MQAERKRKYFLGANWKCNGTVSFVKEIVTHLINDLEYDKNNLGKSTLFESIVIRGQMLRKYKCDC